MDDRIITASRLYWPSFYESYNFEPSNTRLYGVSILWDDLPEELRWVDWRLIDPAKTGDSPDLANTKMIRLTAKHPPQIVTAGDNRNPMRQVADIFRFSDAANIKRDWLFHRIHARLAVVEYEVREPRSGMTKRRLGLRAVEVDYTHVLAKYDEICARYFTDPSYPL